MSEQPSLRPLGTGGGKYGIGLEGAESVNLGNLEACGCEQCLNTHCNYYAGIKAIATSSKGSKM